MSAATRRRRPVRSISLEAAQSLLDFRGPGIDASLAQQQLEGAVAIHNILAREGIAYLADEVGLGKTYIALGVVGLLRYFRPDLRVLYIAPRENIQKKWMKELANFTHANWQHRDQRVRTLTDQPTARLAFAHNLMDLARHVLRDPRCDPFLRMPSFSPALPTGAEGRERWRDLRRRLMAIAPLFHERAPDLRTADRGDFVDWYGERLNAILPHYDLVIVDEAHHLKHGLGSDRTGRGVATRNHLLARTLGTLPTHDDPPGYGPRFSRVLLLSATPLESDFLELHRQLDLFGFGGPFRTLAAGDDVSTEDKRATASRVLVRRVTELMVNGRRVTKNLYRREWRGGGVACHDEPLEIPDDRQKLIVALIQKKVADVLHSPRFGASFQIGMLSSFESFYETARNRLPDGQVFEGEEQRASDEERRGVDSYAVGRIADSYRRKFGAPLPHPKMDAVVTSLDRSLRSGEKTLVFVRRVKSVPELGDKLREIYDRQLQQRLFAELPESVHADLTEAWAAYDADQSKRIRRAEVGGGPDDDPAEAEVHAETDDAEMEAADASSEGSAQEALPPNDTFFAWFFRGEPRGRWLSGAAFRKGRLQGQKSPYGTFFDDNHVMALLDLPADVPHALAAHLGRPRDEVERELHRRAWHHAQHSTSRWDTRIHRYRAHQEAALHMLAEAKGRLAHEAEVILDEVYDLAPPPSTTEPPPQLRPTPDVLNVRTFFTELRRRPHLCARLWPEAAGHDFRARFREHETRRELLAAAARLGHAYLDLWIEAIHHIGTLRAGRDTSDDRPEALIRRFLDRLEHQRDRAESSDEGESSGTFDAWAELSRIADHHPTIVRLNFPNALDAPLPALSRIFGRALAKQTPVGGMHGGVNGMLVAQFRMPGYPLALVTTDVVQEGEDLHLFCDRVVHYGITWTPSAMEQRTGRVDRVGCLVRRRLEPLTRDPWPDELLQVHYPYLGETLERLQVREIFRRMNRFMELVHRGYGSDEDDRSAIDASRAMLDPDTDAQPILTPLVSAFPVLPQHTTGEVGPAHIGDPERRPQALLTDLDALWGVIERRYRTDRMPQAGPHTRVSVLHLHEGQLVGNNGAHLGNTLRRQPIFAQLRTAHTGEPLIHLSSPIGTVTLNDEMAVRLMALQRDHPQAKLCQHPAPSRGQALITLEADLLVRQAKAQPDELRQLVERVVLTADHLEHVLFDGHDADPHIHRETLLQADLHG